MKTRLISYVLPLLALASPAMAQRATVEFEQHSLAVHSGIHDGQSEARVAFSDLVRLDGAPWLRLHIADYHLGAHSYVILRSLTDFEEQRLDSRSLPLWQNKSAMFNGDAVEVELHVALGDAGVFVSVDGALSGLDVYGPAIGSGEEGDPRSLCGADNRTASTDNRVGRLYFGGCTAWFITNGAFLTAGHCVDTEQDSNGNPIPDGGVDLNGFVEFNVPASTANGNTVAAAVNDQFPIQVATVAFFFDGVNSVGEDWSVFQVGPNGLGEMPWDRYSTVGFRPSRETPAVNDNITVTGFGLDNTPAGSGGAGALCCTRDSNNNCTFDCNAQHFTNQTETGPFVSETNDNANDISLHYQVDTTGGNSGSPVIWLSPSPDVAIGIHTNAGCTSGGGGSNAGTAFENNGLETAMRNVTGTSARFADSGHPHGATLGDGTICRPFDTVTEAVASVPNGGVVAIVAGSYPAAAGNIFTAGTGNVAMILRAPVGNVIIGE